MKTFGDWIRISIFGASHDEKIGVIIEGLPEDLSVDEEELAGFMRRRAPGRFPWETPRREEDRVIFEKGPAGGSIEAVIYNRDVRPADYSVTVPRPGHADYCAWVKEGRIQTGGGRWSGRMTAPLCIAGGIAKQILAGEGISVDAHILELAGVKDEFSGSVSERFPVCDETAAAEMIEKIMKAKAEGDSLGGYIECVVTGMPAGIGDALFGGLESHISEACFAVPAVKAIEFGDTRMTGSSNNDAFVIRDGRVMTATNHHGGILGGVSTGMPIVFRVLIKPTPSIGKEQRSVDLEKMEEVEMTVKGRHDPCILPRAVPCIEAACAVAILDMMEGERNGDR